MRILLSVEEGSLRRRSAARTALSSRAVFVLRPAGDLARL